MPIIKPSEEKLDKLKENERWLLQSLERGRIFYDGEKTEFWKAIKEIIQINIENIDELLDNHAKLTQDGKTAILEARRQNRKFLSMVSDAKAERTHFERELIKIRKEIDEYRQRLGKSK